MRISLARLAVDGSNGPRADPYWRSALIVLAIYTSTVFCGEFARADEQELILAGELLIVTNEMADRRFAETVIYIAKHDVAGTLGLIINRPMAKVTLEDLLKGLGVNAKTARGEIVIHFGGPVSQRQGFLLHSDDVLLESSSRINNGIVMTSDAKMIEAVAAGKGPRQYLFAVGYAGWAPGQVAAEIAGGSWFTIPNDGSLIFADDAERKWLRATAKRRISL